MEDTKSRKVTRIVEETTPKAATEALKLGLIVAAFIMVFVVLFYIYGYALYLMSLASDSAFLGGVLLTVLSISAVPVILIYIVGSVVRSLTNGKKSTQEPAGKPAETNKGDK